MTDGGDRPEDRFRRVMSLWARTIMPYLTGGMFVALLAGIVALFFFYQGVSNRLERLRTMQFDNSTWVVAQLEVDMLKLQRDLLRESLPGLPPTGAQGETDSEEITVADRIAVLYSRLRVVDSYDMLQEALRTEPLATRWARVRAAVSAALDLTETAGPDPDRQRGALLDLIMPLQEDVRAITVTLLEVTVTESSKSRADIERLMGLLLRGAVALMVLLLVIGLVLLRIDLGLRTQARALRRANSNLSRTIESALEGMVVFDQTGRIQAFNRAAETIFGRTSAEVIGREFTDVIVPLRLRQWMRDALAEYLRTGQGTLVNRGRMNLTAMREDGSEFPVEAAMVAAQSAEGRQFFINFVRDVTDQQQLERNLRRARDEAERNARLRSRFLAVLSHDMRTPLTGMIAALDLLAETRMTKRQARLAEVARGCSHAALEQVEDVLELLRLNEKSRPEAPTDFDPVAVVRDLCDQISPLAQQRGNTVEVAFDGEDPGWVRAMRRSFSLAVRNILSNAVKFTTDGTVRVTLTLIGAGEDLALRVAIADEGIGISPEQQGQIFEDFVTFDPREGEDRPTGFSRGTGLGLGFVRRAVETMKGTLELDSTPGKGSTFRFTIPVKRGTAPVAARAPAPALPAAAGARLHVLLADDNEANRFTLTEMVRHLGHQAVAVADGRAARDAARDEAFDLVLMDLQMPVMDGLEAMKAIRTGGKSKDRPIVGVTAHASRADFATLVEAGFTDVVIKPVSLATLADLLARGGAPAKPAPQADAAAIDLSVTQELRDTLGSEVVDGLLRRFFDETATELAALAGPAGADGEQVARRMHYLAGSAATFGARGLHKALKTCEDRARAGDFAAVRLGTAEVHRLFAQLREVLLPEAQG